MLKQNSQIKVLKATPATVHWGYLDAAIPPALTIDSGEQVRIECVTGGPEWLPPADRGFDLLPDLLEVIHKVKKGSGNHIFTGPVYVRGAEIGDVLEVKILDIELRQNWGWNIFRSYMGTVPEDYRYTRLMHVALDLQSKIALMPSGFRIPLAPFFGQLAVAPPAAVGRQNSKEPREFGGNLDCKELTSGSTIYLPVWNVGALFSTGDGHAAQGDGEVNGTAIETSLAGTFEFVVRKDLGWKIPRAETPTHYITFGLDPDLDDAARQCLKEMISWIIALTGIHKDEAYSLCSFVCDLHVTQTVNNVKGVHAMLPKSVLVK
ncbi:MAG TPA: acetamidase/formamidase family protein [Candidatus Binatia bacterium]|jgi:acetamidase/formamidase